MIKTISCEELREWQQEKKDFILLDVRSVAEWQAGHIEGSLNIPLHILPLRMSELPHRDTPIVCCCQSGGRSGQATMYLERAGYSKVMNLRGGYGAFCLTQ